MKEYDVEDNTLKKFNHKKDITKDLFYNGFCGYFDEIKKQRIKENSNEVGGSNLLVYPAVTL